MPKTSGYDVIASLPTGTYVEVIVPMGSGYKNYKILASEFKAAVVNNFAGITGNPRDNDALEGELDFLQDQIDLLSSYGIIRVWYVGSQAAMLSLSEAKPGDMAYRTDIAAGSGRIFKFDGPTTDYALATRWVQNKKVPVKLEDLDVDTAGRSDQKVVYWDESTQTHKYKTDAAGDPSALLSSDAEYALGTSTTKAPQVKQVKDSLALKLNISDKATNLDTDGNTKWTPADLVRTWVLAQIAALVDSSPSTLDTLNELAAALGDDPNFATTITTLIGQKVAKSDKATQANYEASTADKWIDSALFALIMGQLSALDTEDKDSVVDAINEVFSYVLDQYILGVSNFPSSNTIDLTAGTGLVRNWLVYGGVGNAATSFTVTNKGTDEREIKGRMFLKKTIAGNVTLSLSPGNIINSVVLTGAINTWYYIEWRGVGQAATTDDFWISYVVGGGGGGGSGVTDGDKGDITISGSGTVYTIDTDAVTQTKIIDGAVTTSKIQDAAVNANKLATDSVITSKILDGAVSLVKMANLAARKIFGRKSATTGAVELIDFSTDGTMSTNSDDVVPSEKAIRTYVGAKLIAENIITLTGNTTLTQSQVDAGNVIKFVINTASSVTITFPSEYTHKQADTSFTSYVVAAGTSGRTIMCQYFKDGTTLNWFFPSDTSTFVQTNDARLTNARNIKLIATNTIQETIPAGTAIATNLIVIPAAYVVLGNHIKIELLLRTANTGTKTMALRLKETASPTTAVASGSYGAVFFAEMALEFHFVDVGGSNQVMVKGTTVGLQSIGLNALNADLTIEALTTSTSTDFIAIRSRIAYSLIG